MPKGPRDSALRTSYERDGYDGVRNGVQWWFEAWGSGERKNWLSRRDAGRPPRPDELARADYIIIGIRRRGQVTYKTHLGGLDFRQ